MCLLNVPSSRLQVQIFGGRSFSRAAPVMCNSLPDGHDMVPASTVGNVGVVFDDKLSLDSHIKISARPRLSFEDWEKFQ